MKIPQCYGECLRFTGVSKGEETMQILTLPWHCPLPSLRWHGIISGGGGLRMHFPCVSVPAGGHSSAGES